MRPIELWGFHTTLEYSSIGLTYTVYALRSVHRLLELKDLSMCWQILKAFNLILFTCSTHVRFADIMMPRSLTEVLHRTCVLSMKNWWLVVDLQIVRCSHLSGASCSCLFCRKSHIEFKSFWSVLWSVAYTFASSAKRLILVDGEVTLARSSMNKMKSNGPSTEPCGTPLLTSTGSERDCLMVTICDLPVRKDFIHWNREPFMSY